MEYASAKTIFNIVPKNEPKFIYECRCVSNVVLAVRAAILFRMPIAVKSG